MAGVARRCSHCGINGHNSRTCDERKGCLKLFGVRIMSEDMDMVKDNPHYQFQDENVPVKRERNEAIHRSFSMGQLVYQQHHHNHQILMQINKYSIGNNCDNGDLQHHGDDGYLSDGLTQYSSCKPKILRQRKKGVPWTEEEHKTFLIGLKKLGRGDWRGISKNFVQTRTPTQVASHAQKYFMRQLSTKDMKKKKKKRMSLFDLPLREDLSVNSPTSPFASPLEESHHQHAENIMNSSGSSSEHAEFQALTFPAYYSNALPPPSPQALVFRRRPSMGCLQLDVPLPKMDNYTLNEDLLKLSLMSPVTPKQVDETRLQLGPKAGLMVDDMLELRIALPVGLQTK